MKKIVLNFILIIVVVLSSLDTLFAKDVTDVWRTNEMEVRIFFENQAQYKYLKELDYDGDVYPNETGLFYLIPSELQKLEDFGFNYKIEKEDLSADLFAIPSDYSKFERETSD